MGLLNRKTKYDCKRDDTLCAIIEKFLNFKIIVNRDLNDNTKQKLLQ